MLLEKLWKDKLDQAVGSTIKENKNKIQARKQWKVGTGRQAEMQVGLESKIPERSFENFRKSRNENDSIWIKYTGKQVSIVAND